MPQLPRPDDNEDTLGFVLHDVARMMRWEFDRRARQLGLTRSQWSVLFHLRRDNGVRQKKLAQVMDVTAITLSGLLDRMERDGWVERRDDASDRRAKRVYLTRKVAPVIDRMLELAAEVRAEALAGLSEAEQEQLMALLQRLRGNLCQQAPPDQPRQDQETDNPCKQ